MKQVNELPSAFHVDILSRELDGDQLKELNEIYQKAKKKQGPYVYEPSALDKELYKGWIKGEITARDAATSMGIKGEPTVIRRFAHIGAKVVIGEIKL